MSNSFDEFYDYKYDSEQGKAIEAERDAILKDANAAYDSAIASSDSYYDSEIKAVEDYGATQSALQEEALAAEEQRIADEKAKADADYKKEQSAAYVDWQKQSDQYGVNAEKMASQGMTNTGYSESSKVAMYAAYQNRVSVAREVMAEANLSYDRDIAEARRNNSVVMAQIAFNTYSKKASLALQKFQAKNNLVLEKASNEYKIRSTYRDMLNQLNEEPKKYLKPKDVLASMLNSTANKNQALINAGADIGGNNNNLTNLTITWDADSIKSLGYGNLTAHQIEDLVEAGLLEFTQKNNKLYVTKSPHVKAKAALGNDLIADFLGM